jgi:ferredoxin
MTYVVTEPCIKCKYTECLQACPVICFHEGQNFLVIDPDDCIDCGACVDPCPVDAIFPESEVPGKWQHYVALNKKYARLWPVITMEKPPLSTAEEFSTVADKAELFDSAPGTGDPG